MSLGGFKGVNVSSRMSLTARRTRLVPGNFLFYATRKRECNLQFRLTARDCARSRNIGWPYDSYYVRRALARKTIPVGDNRVPTIEIPKASSPDARLISVTQRVDER